MLFFESPRKLINSRQVRDGTSTIHSIEHSSSSDSPKGEPELNKFTLEPGKSQEFLMYAPPVVETQNTSEFFDEGISIEKWFYVWLYRKDTFSIL